jgi:hypothetical protein
MMSGSRSLRTFRRNVLLPSSECKGKLSMQKSKQNEKIIMLVATRPHVFEVSNFQV